MFNFFKKWRRKRIASTPLSEEHVAYVRRNVLHYDVLPEGDRHKLDGLIQIFIAEKRFEGCGGLEITDEIRLTIAAQACILLLGQKTDIYPKLRSILVYPQGYVSTLPSHLPDGTVYEGPQARLGESWEQGYVVLSWDDVLHGASDPDDGKNVVYHEFAHQLDSESGSSEGAPILPRPSMYIAWARILGKEYESLIEKTEKNLPSLLDKYGATNPAEFFAVVTEFFFERPGELKLHHPELYQQMQLFYGQDPVDWGM
jgi:Mlc titration factor MtfA (ptsG expression regulator)